MLTPAGPGVEPHRAKHLVQARVRLEVARQRLHTQEGAAHCIRGGTRVRGDEEVQSSVFVRLLTISVFLRKVGRSRTEQCWRRRMT
jgi:hypothetical protein